MNTKKYIQKGVINGLALFSFLLVLPVGTSISSICFGVLITLSVFYFILYIKEIKPVYIYLTLSIPLLIYILGLINTENLSYGIKFIFRNISLFMFPFIFMVLQSIKIPTDKILKYFLVGATIASLYLISLFVYYFNIGTKFYVIVTLELFHSTYLGMYILFSSFISYYFYKKNNKFIFLFLTVFFLITAILSSSRIIILLSFFFIGYLIFSEFKHRKWFYLILVPFIILMGIIVINIPSIKGKFIQFVEIEKIGFDKNNYQSLSSRFAKIEASINLIKTSPFFGSGTGDLYTELHKEYERMGFTLGIKNKYNSHNQYLENISRNGIIGGIISLLFLYLIPLILAIKSKNGLLIGFLAIISLVSLTESILVVQRGIYFYSFFVCLLLSKSIIDSPRYFSKWV